VTTARRATWAAALLLALHLGGAPARAEGVVLDDFETLAGWTTVASEGARVWTLQEPGHSGMGMRVGFDLGAGGGYVIVHKQLSLPLPENYAFTFSLRGEGRRNNFEFKLLDPTGKNVWWRNQRDFSFPTDWQRVTIRKSRLGLAWGPSKAREPKQVGAIELAISAGEGGSGSFWIDDLGFEEREPAVQDGVPPDVQASTSLAGHEPPLLLDEDPATGWKSDPVPSTQWVLLDFRKNRENHQQFRRRLRSISFIHRDFSDEIPCAFNLCDVAVDLSRFLDCEKILACDFFDLRSRCVEWALNVWNRDASNQFRMSADKAFDCATIGWRANPISHIDGVKVRVRYKSVNGCQPDIVSIDMIWFRPVKGFDSRIGGSPSNLILASP